MKKMILSAALLAAALAALAQVDDPSRQQAPQAQRRRGFAVAEAERPKSFPHRIWAASDFEARPADFGWFGGAEGSNIPAYPGNVSARRGTPQKNHAALKTGMNPVPGPRMGTNNHLYLRYYLKGTDQAVFQHYSLSCGDNCNIRVSGLVQGRWSETVLNFTRDSRRNDGSPGAFKKGERMDDLQVYVGKPGDGKTYELIIDDAVFFATEPGLPPEKEPFPNRVIFLAAFDTGTDARSRPKYYPGQWALPTSPPPGSYWQVAQAVAAPDEKASHVLLKMAPPRHAGPETKLRFRYWVRGSGRMQVALHDATAKAERTIELKDLPQGKWVTQYVNFTKDAKAPAGAKPLAVRNELDALTFVVPGSGEGVRLYVDEVVLYDAGKP